MMAGHHPEADRLLGRAVREVRKKRALGTLLYTGKVGSYHCTVHYTGGLHEDDLDLLMKHTKRNRELDTTVLFGEGALEDLCTSSQYHTLATRICAEYVLPKTFVYPTSSNQDLREQIATCILKYL